MVKDYKIESFFPSAEYVVENAYIYDWECDIFLQMKSGYHYEIEQKISRSDFRADFRKQAKHFQFKNSKSDLLSIPGGKQTHYLYPDILDSFDYDITDIIVKRNYDDTCLVWISSYLNIRKNKIPNRFYYITPKGLLNVKEIPKYAGLLEYEEGVITQSKPSPWLHKNKYNYDKILLDKYKWRYESIKSNNDLLKQALDKFRDVYDNPEYINHQSYLKF